MAIDYTKLREQTLQSAADEEAVTVNTRALIDKVLARYSGEWTTLRELMQNAADAQAKKVLIKFETVPSRTTPVPQSQDDLARFRHVLLHHTVQRLIVTNDGVPFGDSDWGRLKRIAEGNPDETKIGAFGVGFYSVFAECESPFVSSGNKTMAFYWKGNSLFTRMGKLDSDVGKGETSFVLDYRNQSAPVPTLMSLCQFLATSLTFVGLENIELWIDDWKVFSLVKQSAPSAAVKLPADVNPKTKDGLMKIVGVEHENAQIHAKWMNAIGWNRVPVRVNDDISSANAAAQAQAPSFRSFFSRLAAGASTNNAAAAKKAVKEAETAQRMIEEHLVDESQATVHLRVSTVNVQTYVSKTLSQELERATKKPPPKHTRIAILTSTLDDSTASLASLTGVSQRLGSDVFTSVLPSKNGRIFIGFPTAQTTGLLAHISAPSVIPTVERESIDLNARYVRDWNVEMLRVAGIACRIAYAGEMAELRRRLEQYVSDLGAPKINASAIEKVMPAAVHVLKQYTFHEATPSPSVGEIIEEAFWTCNRKATIEILSTRGVLPCSEVRLTTDNLSFVEDLPLVPDTLSKDAGEFIHKLQVFGLISEITISDISGQLQAKPLNETQLTEFLHWSAKQISNGNLDGAAIRSLFGVAVATFASDEKDQQRGEILILGTLRNFLIPSKIPADMPVPPVTTPFRFTSKLSRQQLESFGWEELQVAPWIRYVVEEESALPENRRITSHVPFAAQVLAILSKQWDSMPGPGRSLILDLLTDRTIMPTKLGLRKPGQAYFPSVKLFDDLPVVSGLAGVKDKLLVTLGVRKTIELGIVFDRLMSMSSSSKEKEASKWSHVELIKYLTSVRSDIPAADIERLKTAAICPSEGGSNEGQPTRLYRLSDLYEPKPDLRNLSLPVLQWPGTYQSASPEGRFMSLLGLKSHPPPEKLCQLIISSAGKGDKKGYEDALGFYLHNFTHQAYRTFDMGGVTTPILPVEGKDLSLLVPPRSCYTNPGVRALGYHVLRKDLHPHAVKLGVVPDPPISDVTRKVLSGSRRTLTEAAEVFTYLSGRLNEINGQVADQLGNGLIVPVQDRVKTEKIRYLAPRTLFLGDTTEYGEIFDFVDFGAEANNFLLKVGASIEPTSMDLAAMISREPARLLSILKGSDRYLALLRKLAANVKGLRANRDVWKALKKAPCLLAYKEILPQTKSENEINDGVDEEDDDDLEPVREYQLEIPSRIVIKDDVVSYSLFRGHLLVAPEEEMLEDFYYALGVPTLGSIVVQEMRKGPQNRDQTPAERLRKLIVERCRLFLHQQDKDAVLRTDRWLDKNLNVQSVQSLSMRYSLEGYNLVRTQKRTASVEKASKVLFVTPKYDFYEVSRELAFMMLKRPRSNDVIALESLLSTDLRKLKTRGFNVDRILRAQAAEIRIAEAERQRQLEEEQKRLQEQQQAWQSQSEQRAITGPGEDSLAYGENPMPGSFTDSPETAVQPPKIDKQSRKPGFFSNLAKQFGLDDERASRQMQNLLGQSTPDANASRDASSIDNPPPYSQKDPRQPKPTSSAPDGTVTAPHELRQNLLSAVQASRAHDSSSVFSPPQTNVVKESGSYCDSNASQDLSFIGVSAPGLKIFLANAVKDKSGFLANHSTGLNTFASLLLDIGNVFLLRPQTLHMYYDESGNSIAFNRQGSLFCNYRFFVELHLANVGQPERKAEAAIYWWVTLCHELAHNIVADHSSEHSFYTESFVMQYFAKMVAKAAQYQSVPSIRAP